MKIALIAPADEKVPPAKYGGTELVIANLANSLIDLGHDVHLFAAGDSTTSAKLHPTFPRSFRTQLKTLEQAPLRYVYNHIALGKAVTQIAGGHFDVVHNHMGWSILPFAPLLDAPVLTTIHGPYDIPFIKEISTAFPHAYFASISDSQQRLMPGLHFLDTVYNGIEVDRFDFSAEPGDYVAFLGRVSPEKGLKKAILAAKKSGIPMRIAAKIDTVDEEYFNTEIAPLIDGALIQFIGEVDHAGKVDLLKHARALLALIQWDEPFGLVMTESMACGTPVIAIGRGSVPELIEHGRNGLIVNDTIEDAVDAIARVETLDRRECRAVVEEKFSADVMARDYLAAYRKIRRIEQAKLPSVSSLLVKPFVPGASSSQALAK